jgi:hypothetical protein
MEAEKPITNRPADKPELSWSMEVDLSELQRYVQGEGASLVRGPQVSGLETVPECVIWFKVTLEKLWAT